MVKNAAVYPVKLEPLIISMIELMWRRMNATRSRVKWTKTTYHSFSRKLVCCTRKQVTTFSITSYYNFDSFHFWNSRLTFQM